MEMTMPAVTKIREDETAPKKERMLIGGKWVDSVSGEWLEVEDPAHRRPIAEVPRGRSEDVARAVKAAADAFPAWSRTVPRERGDALEARVDQQSVWLCRGRARAA
jgi:delta 1-pyrroline-5-carboxylate dehydrogenase